MGKRIIQRARGKGGPPYKSPSHRYPGKIKYNFEKAEVVDIIHDRSRDSPLAKIKFGESEGLIIAAEGLTVGETLDRNGKVKRGNVMTIAKVPKGMTVFAIETRPGSGPKLCCSPGTKALVVSHEEKRIILQMPSKKFKNFNPRCLATVGIPAGGGRRIKPYVKAGQKYHAKKARNKLYPRTSAIAMNAVDHPFGGRGKPGHTKTVSRHAPPGAKVGSLAARRGGRKKRK